MFQGNLMLAYLFIKTATLVILFILSLAFLFKVRLIRIKKKKAAFQAKHELYFQYVQAHLDDPGALRIPQGRFGRLELEVFQEKLGEWIDMLTGSHQQKLIDLSEQLELVDMNLKRLKSPFSWRRTAAAYHLGLLRARRAAPHLMRRVRKEKYGPNFVIYARSAAQCTQDGNDLKELMALFAKHNKNAASLAADIFRRSPAAEPGLIEELLQSRDLRLVKIALHCLKGQAFSHLAPTLEMLMDAPDKEVRILASEIFLHSSPVLTRDTMTKMLTHSDGEIRAIAAKAAGLLGTFSCIDMLKQAMLDPDWSVRQNSAKSLAMLGEEGFDALCEIAVHSDDPYSKDMANDVIHEELMKRKTGSGNASTPVSPEIAGKDNVHPYAEEAI